MANVIKVDELNIIGNANLDDSAEKKTQRSMPYEKYFGEMGLTKAQYLRRLKMAEELEDIFFWLFYTIIILDDDSDKSIPSVERDIAEGFYVGKSYVSESAKKLISESVSKRVAMTAEISEIISRTVDFVVDSTVRHKNDKWYQSKDRAVWNAEETANTICNADEFDQAKDNGKGKKKWISMKDERVRESHRNVDDELKPIDERFSNGLMYPREPGAPEHEVANCRCTIKYF